MGVLSEEEKHTLVPQAIALLILKCLTQSTAGCLLPLVVGAGRSGGFL